MLYILCQDTINTILVTVKNSVVNKDLVFAICDKCAGFYGIFWLQWLTKHASNSNCDKCNCDRYQVKSGENMKISHKTSNKLTD